MIMFSYTYKKAWESVLVARPTVLASRIAHPVETVQRRSPREDIYSTVYLVCTYIYYGTMRAIQ